jgi:hypothetical protein
MTTAAHAQDAEGARLVAAIDVLKPRSIANLVCYLNVRSHRIGTSDCVPNEAGLALIYEGEAGSQMGADVVCNEFLNFILDQWHPKRFVVQLMTEMT